MKSASAYVKTVKFEMGYGGCSAPAKPVPMMLPCAVPPATGTTRLQPGITGRVRLGQ